MILNLTCILPWYFRGTRTNTTSNYSDPRKEMGREANREKYIAQNKKTKQNHKKPKKENGKVKIWAWFSVYLFDKKHILPSGNCKIQSHTPN